jgi:hypothetical protein
MSPPHIEKLPDFGVTPAPVTCGRPDREVVMRAEHTAATPRHGFASRTDSFQSVT